MSFKELDWDDLSEKECKGRSLRIWIKGNTYFRLNKKEKEPEKKLENVAEIS